MAEKAGIGDFGMKSLLNKAFSGVLVVTFRRAAAATPKDGPGYQQLLQLLGSAQDCLVALEATGHYWRNLYAALGDG